MEKMLVDFLDDIVYISDVDNYDLLFVNEAARKMIGIAPGQNLGKCYRTLQGQDAPCEFCTNCQLSYDSFYIWEHDNHMLSRHFLAKDKLVTWCGRRARLEIAIDITEKENTSRAVQDKLVIERALVSCVRCLTMENSLTDAINTVLTNVGEFYLADRAYIFDFSGARQDEKTLSNTYEWCAPGVTPQKDNLQEITAEEISSWIGIFQERKPVIVSNLELEREHMPQEYALLKPQGIHSLMVVPLYNGAELTGLVGVDNPRYSLDDSSLLESLTYFLSNEMQKRAMERRLEYASYHDALTGLYNRNRYISFLKQINSAPPASLGVAFMDLNGLKRANDSFGHAYGDALIVNTARIVSACFEGFDLFRIGGDEFVVCCRNIGQKDFFGRIEQTSRQLREGKCEVSVGSVWSDHSIDADAMAALADERMYEDKERYRRQRARGPHPSARVDLPDARYRVIVQQLGAGIFEWNRDGNALEHPLEPGAGSNFISDDLAARIGYTERDGDFVHFLLNKEVVHPQDISKFKSAMRECTVSQHAEVCCRLRILGEGHRWHRITVMTQYDESGQPMRIIGAVMDVELETNMRDRLRNLANHDSITPLLNQQAFYRVAGERMERGDGSFAVVMMDIDKFKVVNDTVGIDGGNRKLRQIAAVLQARLREGEVAGRMYADVFCLLLCGRSDGEIMDLIDDVTNTLGALEDDGARMVPAFGVCRVGDRHTAIATYCEMAGFAHKAVKNGSPCRWAFYDEDMRLQVLRERQMESEMEYALRDGQFEVYLQPKYDLAQDRIVGSEALVRWCHPTRGMVSPAEFIPLFERDGLILKLDEYVWEQVCKMQRRWLDMGCEVMPISVNVSRLHLFSPGFKEIVLGLLDRYRLPRRLIELELTESLFMENMGKVSPVLQELRSSGFTLDLDDFGSGYSSLNMLETVPLDVLKIDCAFFQPDRVTPRSRAVVKSIIALAGALNMQVVAEGVETKENVDFLRQAGCTIIQGYYFSKPMPWREYEQKYCRQR